MTTRSKTIVRIAAFMLFIAAAFGAPATMHAQTDKINCICKTLGIEVSEKVQCEVTICIQLSEKPDDVKCVTLKPGGSIDVKCPPYALGIQLCNGKIDWIIPGGSNDISRCSEILPVAPRCCVRACFGRGTNNDCPAILIQPGLCLTRDC